MTAQQGYLVFEHRLHFFHPLSCLYAHAHYGIPHFFIRLADNNLDATVLSSLASALRTGDAVKFAKYQPAVYESEQSLEQVAAAIQQVEQQAQTDKQ